MSDQELILTIWAITAGVGFSTFLFSQIFKLIRLSIEKRHGQSVTGDARDMQLREEFVKFRKQTEQRIALLEVAHGAAAPEKLSDQKPLAALPEADPEESDRLPNMLKSRA